MARPSKGLSESQLVVRLSGEMRAKLEALRDALSKRAGGVAIPLSAVVRQALERGVERLERETR